MKRWAVLGSTLCMILSLSGCGGDQREEDIRKALGLFDLAAANRRKVRTDLEDALKKLPDGKQLTKDDLKLARDDAKKLRDVGKQLLEVKASINLLQEGMSDADKEALRNRFQSELNSKVESLVKEDRQLNEVLDKVAKRVDNNDSMKELRDAVRSSREDMFILTKQQ
jgi:hypothetical protein